MWILCKSQGLSQLVIFTLQTHFSRVRDNEILLEMTIFHEKYLKNTLEGQRCNSSLRTHFLWGISDFVASGKIHFLYAPCGATRTFPNIIGLDIHYFMPAFRTVTITRRWVGW